MTPWLRYLIAFVVGCQGSTYIPFGLLVPGRLKEWRGSSWLLGTALTGARLNALVLALHVIAGITTLACAVAIGFAPSAPRWWRPLVILGTTFGIASFAVFWDGQIQLLVQEAVGAVISLITCGRDCVCRGLQLTARATIVPLAQLARVPARFVARRRSCTCAGQQAAAAGERRSLGGHANFERIPEMRARCQWRTSVRISAPRDRVWAIVDDISLIPQYHPEVRKVDLLSGRSTTAIGVKYRCTIPEGRRSSCIEEVVDYVPGQRMATAFLGAAAVQVLR